MSSQHPTSDVAAPSSLVARPIKVTQRRHALSVPRQLRTIIDDDNEDICELTAELLTARGHPVTSATLFAAVETLGRQSPATSRRAAVR